MMRMMKRVAAVEMGQTIIMFQPDQKVLVTTTNTLRMMKQMIMKTGWFISINFTKTVFYFESYFRPPWMTTSKPQGIPETFPQNKPHPQQPWTISAAESQKLSCLVLILLFIANFYLS